MSGTLNGYTLIIQPPVKTKIERGIIERFFSFPWNPFKKVRYELRNILGDGQLVKNELEKTIHMNEETFKSVQRALQYVDLEVNL